MLLSEFRQQYPMYGDLSDAELADGLHRKFYSDIPRFEFDQKLGLAVNAEPSWAGDPNAIATPPDMTPRFPGGGDLPSVGFEMQQPEPMPQPALMAPTPSGLGALSVEPAATGAVPVMPSLTQALDLDEDRWGIGGAGSLDYALGGSVPAALDPVPMPADPYSGTPDWQAYPGLVVRGAAETGLGMGMALEALPQQQTDETRAFYDEYLTIQPGDRDTAEDLIRRVQRSAMTPGRKSIFTQAIAETVRSGAKMGSRDLGIDVPVDTETGTRYGRAREVLRETFPASDEQEQSLPGQVARGIGSTVGFLPFSVVPGGIWAAGALSGAGEAADRAYRTGASPEQQGTATTLGMVPGALDALAIDSIIRGVTRTPGAAGWLRAIALTGLRTGAIEGTTEGVQQAMQNVIARVTYDPDAAIAEGVPESALVGMLSGGALGAVGGAFSRSPRDPVAAPVDPRQEPPPLATDIPPAPDDPVAAAQEAVRQSQEVRARAAATTARNAERLGMLPDGSAPPVMPGPNDAQNFQPPAAIPEGAQPGEAIIGPVEPPAAPAQPAAPPRVPAIDLPQAAGFPTDQDIGVQPVPEAELQPPQAAPPQASPPAPEIAPAPLSEPAPAKATSPNDYATSPIPAEPRSSELEPASAANGAQPSPEVSAADQPTSTYQTAKGSRYQVFPDGTTVRDKAARPEHPGDQGIKDRTERTVYLDMDGARALAPPNSATWRVIDHGDGTASLATRRDDGRWGISQSARNIPFTTEPAVGRVPLELWGREAVNGLPGYGKAHFGNPITAVQDAGPPANAMPAQAPTPSEQANIDQTPSERAQAAPMPAPVLAPSADARTERGPSADGPQRLPEAVQAAPADTIQARVIDSDTAITPAGTDVPVRYAVVELDSLIPSQTDEGSPNPRFTGEQPRDRSRAASQAQIAEIAGRLDPRRLDRNPSTADGAPLVGPDGMVDSGNGRVLALRRAYAATFPSARRYRDHLAQQGYPVEGMRQPVLVRINDAAPEMRARIASESNARSTLAMSATEQAMADAKAMATVLPTYRGGEVTAAANRDFVRRFIDQAVGAGDRGTIIDSQGQLSGPGIRRIQAAMLAAAYGDANIVETLVESADNDIKAIGGALVDAAPAWAQMRQEAEAGQIDPDMATYTPDLLEAVRLVQRARADDQHVADMAAQIDMFGGRTISEGGEGFLRLFFRDTRFRSQRGRAKIAEALTFYAEEARKTQPGAGLFGDAERTQPADILTKAREKIDGPEQQQGDLLAQNRQERVRDSEGVPPTGRDAGQRAPVQPADGGGDRGAAAAEPARGEPAAGRPPDPVEPDAAPRYQAERRPAFYSALTRGVESVSIPRGPREQWLGIIRNLAQKGVKQAEIEWSGVEQWLRDAEGPITKDRVLDYLRSQEVQVQEVEKGGEDAKYGSYVLPGGENYRELLLTLPPRDTVTVLPSATPAGWGDVDGGNVGVEVRGDRGGDYRSGHFDEPNVLAHIRFNERTGANGERVLFVEEIQSDWHQAGRKTGYSGRTVLTPEEREFDALMAVPRDERSRDQRNRVHVLTEDGTHASWLMKTRRTVPDAPLKATWHETAFRRAVRWAAENGFDRVAWTTGEQQVERFDLSKQISELTLHGTGNNLRLSATDHRGQRVIDMKHTTREGLADLIGKEPAERLLGQPEPTGPYSARRLSGMDLKVGGEGMRGFYDKILVDYANKFGKRFGARVEPAHVSTSVPVPVGEVDTLEVFNTRTGEVVARHNRFDAAEADVAQRGPQFDYEVVKERPGPGAETHSLPITPEMRDSIMRDGVPLWQSGREGGAAPLDIPALAAELRRLAPQARWTPVEELRAEDGRLMSGGYFPSFRAIVVAATSPDPMNTMRHEAVHALRDFGLISEQEWARLSREAERTWLKRYDIDARYPSLDREAQIEEAIAEAFADHPGTPLAPLDRPLWERIKRFFDRLGAWFRGQGFQTADDVLGRVESGDVGRREADGEAREAAPAYQVPRLDETPAAVPDAQRSRTALDAIRDGQPIDRMMRLPFRLLGGVTERGEWKPGLRLADWGAEVVTERKLDPNGRFAWLNPTIEKVRAGVIDRYGQDPEYVARDRRRQNEETTRARQGLEIVRGLVHDGMDANEAAILQAVLTGEPIPPGKWEKVAPGIRAAIDEMGAEAMALGLISAESYERNRGAYLNRSYLKHEATVEGGGLGRLAQNMGRAQRVKLIGSELKGRGIFIEIDPEEIDPKHRVRGTMIQVLDDARPDTTGKMKNWARAFVPAGEAVPAKYADWTDKGAWEVRQTAPGKLVLWRDYTKAERERMGEILDARYTIAKTFYLMAHDLATGRFYQDIATNEAWATRMQPPEGTWVNAREANIFAQLATDVEWVKVPDTAIEGTAGVKKWGALAGMYVRSEIWRDLNQVAAMANRNAWDYVLSQWKLNKTARSPVTHMNNVMSNILFMDMNDVRMQDLVQGVRSYMAGDQDFKEAEANGAFGTGFVGAEIRREVLEPILREIEAEATGKKSVGAVTRWLNQMGAVGRVMAGLGRAVKKADEKMLSAYRAEDDVFRMALYKRRRAMGDSAEAAANAAREVFLDYDIRAPWVNAARRTVLPFIAYTYRAVPGVAKAVATKPWKLAKYVLLAQMANIAAYSMWPGDEDEERRNLRKDQRGHTWVGSPRMLRLWVDSDGPNFLDIRRWIPAGDIFDLNQGSPAVPLPSWLQLGGPLQVGIELMMNRSNFTGKDIVNKRTDDGLDQAGKVADYLWKSWAPSAVWVPGGWYQSKVIDALSGVRDRTGNQLDPLKALVSSFGIKVQGMDLNQAKYWRQAAYETVKRDLAFERNRAIDDHARGAMSDSAYRSTIADIAAKEKRAEAEVADILKDAAFQQWLKQFEAKRRTVRSNARREAKQEAPPASP